MHNPPDMKSPTCENSNNMALPTGTCEPDEQDYMSAEEEKEEKGVKGDGWQAIAAAQAEVFQRLLPVPQLPGLRDRVLLAGHIKEVDALLSEAGMLIDGNFASGHQGRCRAAIATSLSGHQELSTQFLSWCSQGLPWTQVQLDLIKTFAPPHEVADSLARAIAKLQYGPTFVNSCRDAFVVHESIFVQRPHLLISFASDVVDKLPPPVRRQVIGKRSDEAPDTFWQAARAFWEPGSSHTILGLIEKRIRSELAVATASRSVKPVRENVFAAADQPRKQQPPQRQATQQVFKHFQPQQPARQQWLDGWVATHPSVWRVETNKIEIVGHLRAKAVDSKGPFVKGAAQYFFLAFKDEATAKIELGAVLASAEYRPFYSKNE